MGRTIIGTRRRATKPMKRSERMESTIWRRSLRGSFFAMESERGSCVSSLVGLSSRDIRGSQRSKRGWVIKA